MAEYEERSMDDLTEEPSQYRLDELRSKGQVAQSRDLTATLALIGVVGVIYFFSGKFVEVFSELLRELFSKEFIEIKKMESLANGTVDWNIYFDVGAKWVKFFALTFLGISFAGIALAVGAAFSQVGFIFTTEPLSPDLDRVNPISGLMRLFSMKSIVEGLKATIKFVVIVSAVYLSVQKELNHIPVVMGYEMKAMLTYVGNTVFKTFGIVLVIMLFLAAGDYFLQWMRFRKQARMTKSEAKQEMKEREGDPQIKARIRTIQRDMARKRMMKSVPKADVVVTNPTHIAVAIIYDPEQGYAPKVVAKGADFLAERIKKIAREHGIPTVENKPLARTLYKHVKVGQMIPRSLYQAVAEVLAYVYKLKGKKTSGAKPKEKRPTPSKTL